LLLRPVEVGLAGWRGRGRWMLEAYGADDGGDEGLAGAGFGHEEGDGGLSFDEGKKGEESERN